MKPLAVIGAVAAALVVAALLATPSFLGGASSSTSSSTSSTATSTVGSHGLQLRLALNSTSLASGTRLGITVSEYNTEPTANNVTKADLWQIQGLSLGACATEGYSVYPFGIAVLSGRYSEANASKGTPLEIYPVVACPMFLRLVTGYLFEPMNDSALILPSSGSSPTLMAANVTVSGEYPTGSLQPLSPGVYTVVAGDEWGAVETIQFSVAGGNQTSSTSEAQINGTLSVLVTIGPTVPVCSSNATAGPAPSSYSSIQAVIRPTSGGNITMPVNWLSSGCDVSGRFQAFLAPGDYQLDLSGCAFVGCKSALPEAFTIDPGQQTTLSVSIDTGIR